MEITGPFFDHTKKRTGRKNCWYLRYSVPRTNFDGTRILDADGNIVLQRHRPYYHTKADAEADIPHILEQHEKAGSGNFLFDRKAAVDYETAMRMVGNVPVTELAKFWRLHHPDAPKRKLSELCDLFLEDVKFRHGEDRHYRDLKYRCGAFINAGFGIRYADTITRQEVLSYVKGLPDAKPRTMRNHKTAICSFFNWLVQDAHEITVNPAGGIKKRMLPKETRKEIIFLPLERATRYLRALERYDPELVLHEVVQLIAGVRADGEMEDFRVDFIFPENREIVIPASVAKTEKREIIDGLEDNFWAWWAAYAPRKGGFLRPPNYLARWDRIRVLHTIADQSKADELARLPIYTLLAREESKTALKSWPWNARRRTFCTFHVAKHQSAAKTALIMRHRGSSYTLHNSYRGLGATQQQGESYFQILPAKVCSPIRSEHVPKGIVLIQQKQRAPKSAPPPPQSHQGQLV